MTALSCDSFELHRFLCLSGSRREIERWNHSQPGTADEQKVHDSYSLAILFLISLQQDPITNSLGAAQRG